MKPAAVALAVLAVAGSLHAQPLTRLTGRVVSDRGEPIADAEVKVEALFGPRGEPFAGQRVNGARTNAKGEWTLIGFKAGGWLFSVSVPGQLPDAIVLPMNVVLGEGRGMAGQMPLWHPVLRTEPVPLGEAGRWLGEAATAWHLGDAVAVKRMLRRPPLGIDAAAQAAAGRLSLLVADTELAEDFFTRARQQDPASFRAALGLGSTALILRNFDAAAKLFGAARDRTKDKDERGYLAAAIADLNRIDPRSGPAY